MGHSRTLFLYFRLFNTQLTVNKWSIYIIFCQWLDSNLGPLELEVIALPTEPQPLPRFSNLYVENFSHSICRAVDRLRTPTAGGNRREAIPATTCPRCPPTVAFHLQVEFLHWFGRSSWNKISSSQNGIKVRKLCTMGRIPVMLVSSLTRLDSTPS